MKKFLICLLSLIMCLAIVSCGDKENGKTDDGKTTPIKAETLDDIGSYKLVRGDTCSEDQKAAAVSLRKALGTVLDNMPALGTDYDGEKSKEILIGNTKREESVKALEGLHYDDYVIKQDGTKIVIAAGSDEALTNAVNFFIENFIDELGQKFHIKEIAFYRWGAVQIVQNLEGIGSQSFRSVRILGILVRRQKN